MTARREASTPPQLPGYEPVRVLGLGGFADVFLYEQQLPKREVAVKVLLAGSLDGDVRARPGERQQSGPGPAACGRTVSHPGASQGRIPASSAPHGSAASAS